MTEQPQATKQCRRCGETKPLLAFAGRQTTCIQCRDAAKARTQERKAAVAYSSELCAKICDLVAMRTPVAKIVEMAGMPTARQMASWRRQHAEFRDAYDLAREQRADARSDRVDEILDDLRAGHIDAPSARVLIEAELKLAAKENPARFGDRTVADITVRPGKAEDKPDTAAWLDKVLGSPIATTSNVVPLLPAPVEEADEPVPEPAVVPAPRAASGADRIRRFNPVTGKLEDVA